jgi:hypothetical protein
LSIRRMIAWRPFSRLPSGRRARLLRSVSTLLLLSRYEGHACYPCGGGFFDFSASLALFLAKHGSHQCPIRVLPLPYRWKFPKGRVLLHEVHIFVSMQLSITSTKSQCLSDKQWFVTASAVARPRWGKNIAATCARH